MQVFLSWSGDRSHALANALREYLPLVIQSIQPWFSPDDIDKGGRWLQDLSTQLQKQSVAIVCVTPESANSPWLLFEAGALSKALEASWVCPVLLGMEPSEVKGPLAQFQFTRVNKEDVRKLLGTLNKRLETPLADAQIDRLHDVLWGDFQKKIDAISSAPKSSATPHRTQLDMLAEVLERVRALERQMAEAREVPDFTVLNNPYALIEHLRPKRSLSRIASVDVVERIDRFSRLAASAEKKIASIEASLAQTPESEGRAALLAERTLEVDKLNSYHAEINRARAKLERTPKTSS